MTTATTPEEREDLALSLCVQSTVGYTSVRLDPSLIRRLLDERDALAAELDRLRPKGEIVRTRYAISHAPKGVKGGPWEAVNKAIAVPTSRIDDAWTIDELALARQLARAVRCQISTAHVVRLVTRRKAKK